MPKTKANGATRQAVTTRCLQSETIESSHVNRKVARPSRSSTATRRWAQKRAEEKDLVARTCWARGSWANGAKRKTGCEAMTGARRCNQDNRAQRDNRGTGLDVEAGEVIHNPPRQATRKCEARKTPPKQHQSE